MFGRKKTKITVQYDAGFQNALYLRGEGLPGLNWDRGVPLKNVSADEWVFETDASFNDGQFKILINDVVYEVGENHPLKKGSAISINPQFPS